MAFFFLTVLTVYGLLNFYVIRRGWQALAPSPAGRRIFIGVTVFLALSFFLGRLTARILPHILAMNLGYLGGLFMAALIYAFFLVLIIDLARLANRILHFFPRWITATPQRAGWVAFWVVLALVTVIMIGGFVAAAYPRVRTLDLTLDRKESNRDRLTVVMVSDIHLSSIWRNGHLKKIVAKVNSLAPDLVLLPGDTLDMDVSPEEEERMTVTLRAIHAPLGVYGVLGNHEYYNGPARSTAYLERAGVRVLQDQAVTVGECLTLVGRKDLSAQRLGVRRLDLERILEGADRRFPLLLMDHQPFHLEEAERNGVDLQLSGHTHAGQLFPITLINKRIYEQYWGYWRRGRTQYYVSCGAGTWGMPVRTGSVSEIIRLRLTLR
jgi:predicted MPP superfamily phosphohydrolase